ncbi:MAG: hypothetical protein WBW88_13400, partial [Rhodothermales bacterium]
MRHRTRFNILLIAAFAFSWTGCRSTETMNQAGFEQEFDEGILNMNDIWKLEGTGNATIKDGRLVLQEDPDGVGMVLWTR